MKAIVKDQYTAARAYFMCIFGLMLFETALQLELHFLIVRNRGRPFVKSSTKHSKIYTAFHKLATLPSPIPLIARHNLPDLIRLGGFVGLNILWGWNSNEFSTDYKLYGWLTIANGGLALLTAARTNFFSIIARVPSPVLLMYHRWIGRATVIHATLHFALNTRHDIVTGQLAEAYSSRRIQIGVMAWVALCIMFLTSLSFVRRRIFEIFYYSHALFFVFVIGALIHATKGPEFLLPGLGLWALDRLIRFISNFRDIEVKSVEQYAGDVVKFKFGGLKGSRPGQIVWVQIPSVSFLNWHPFTIASAPANKESTLAIRGLGNFTKKLQRFAGASGATQIQVTSTADQIDFKMRVDGPYGLGGIHWGMHPVTVLVAGGIGITPGISIATHIINNSSAPNPHTKSSGQWSIHLLWVIKDPQHARWFEEELTCLALQCSSPEVPVTLDVAVHITGGGSMPDSVPMQGKAEAAMEGPYTYGGPGVVFQGRPNIDKWFGDVRAARPGQDAAVNACGPRHMTDAVRKAASKTSSRDGLFYVEEEVFEL